jgi:phosphoenolpyruvate carboxylase
MWQEWPFFRSVISTLEMALMKADLGVAKRYLELVEPDAAERMWGPLCREHARVVQRVLDITGQSELLEATPRLRERLEHRNPWVDPLSHMQVELLRRVRGGDESARRALIATMPAIAAGMRNTG